MLNFYRLPQDYLKFEGADRLDLINRLSTNLVNSLDKYGGVKTILTSDKGRFIDLLHLYNFGDFVFSTCSFKNTPNVMAHLDKYTIMDDFKAADISGTHGTILFYGDNVTEYFKEVLGENIRSINHRAFKIVSHDGHDAIITQNDDAFGGFYFIFSTEGNETWERLLFSKQVIAKYELTKTSEKDFDTQRVLYGIPKFGNEMTNLTNPLECGLNKYVSFTKGCYIGQEVIARLDAYDKINKHMIGFYSKKKILLTKKTGDAKITLDGKECGFVTSSAHSDKQGNIGLGFIKTIFLDYTKDYKIRFEDKLSDCKIIKLPFG
ncbi:MAG: hypothetical protein IT281_09005 [Ignavibacteria bacterium]|nr:hypothetical protein [Ignavibacteria bacterium]MCC7159664.1 hypothetical protein [Ignavibacteria bacterium]